MEPTNEKQGILMEPGTVPSYTETSGAPPHPDPEAPVTAAPAYSSGPADAPPSYDSIYGKLKQMKDTSNSNADYAQKVVKFTCCSTVALIIWSALLLALPIAMISIGSVKLHDCRHERYIPIYLIVWGVFGVIKSLSNIVGMVRNRGRTEEDEEGKKLPTNPLDGCISLFLFAWFIAGSYWIYHIHKTYQSDNPSLSTYCDNTLYLFAFWVQTVMYIFMALSIAIGCLGCVCICCLGIFSNKG